MIAIPVRLRPARILAASTLIFTVAWVVLHWSGQTAEAHLPVFVSVLPPGWVVLLGAGAGAGLLAGLIGVGGGIVVVPVVYYGLVAAGMSGDAAAHVAIGTSLAAIMPAALVSSFTHWRAGHTDIDFLRLWGPGIVVGVVTAQLAAPHVSGAVMTGVFSLLCLAFAARFGTPGRFRPLRERPPSGHLRVVASVAIGLFSGLAGVGGGIMTNIVMSLSGMPMHKCVGRAAAVGVVVSAPRDDRRGVGAGRARREPARLHRSDGVGLHRSGADGGGVVRRPVGEVRRRRHPQPHHGGDIADDRRGDATDQPERQMILIATLI